METAAAFQLREPPKLVTSLTLIHLVEMVVAGFLMVFIILPTIFNFSLLSTQFWGIYTRFYVTGLFGTFFYVALTLPLSVILGFLMGWARVSRIRIFPWPAAPDPCYFRVVVRDFADPSTDPGSVLRRFQTRRHRRGGRRHRHRDALIRLPSGNLPGGLSVG